ncbi:rRNA methyltransferase 1, mitochondrial-like isoform X2 [Babylonia areolata]|uniref:rRNA methyltransferase 1, mitochondrial-like isoform X2 n=1 Tax=Babylonia areolata TaxID=304850 RepID=UPI003FD6A8EC
MMIVKHFTGNTRWLSKQTVPALMKLVHLQDGCCSFFTKDSSSHVQKNIPKYNYELPGKGKGSKSQKRKGRLDQHVPVHSEGEIVFGVHPVTLALSSHLRSHLYTVFMDRKHRDSQPTPALYSIHDLAARRQVPVHYVPRNTLTCLSGNRPHQGVCLDASPRLLPHCDPQQLIQGLDLNPSVLWLLLYNVQDPMNMGAILRSCYFLGVDRVIVPHINSCVLSPVVSKASAGAMEVMDIHQVDGHFRSVQHLTQVWQSEGGKVVGTTSGEDSSCPVYGLQDFTVSAPTLLIVGNEGSGIDRDVVELCDTLLTIPPPSRPHADPAVSSLNVSVATGILIHWLRTAACAGGR